MQSNVISGLLWFGLGFVLAAGLFFGAKIKRVISPFLKRAQKSFRHAVPENADKGLAAGWAAASGAFMSLVLQNIGPFISASDPLLQVFALVFLSIAVTALTLYLYLVHKNQVVLTNTWPFVIWSHYRPLLTKVAAAVRPYGYVDYVTHQGFDLNNHFLGKGPIELRYGPCRVDETIVLICDVESLTEIDVTPLIKEGARKQAPLEGLGAPDHSSFYPMLAKKLRYTNSCTPFIPMRWGFNALAIKCDDENVMASLRTQYLGTNFSGIDLFDFLTNKDNATRCLLRGGGEDYPLITFEWFLPPMMLMVCAALGNGAWTQYKSITDSKIQQMLKAVETWLNDSVATLTPIKPIINSVVEIQDVLSTRSRCVVLAGGNFLWNRDSGGEGVTPDNLIVIPVNFGNENIPSCLIWCEVLAIFTTAAKKNDSEWRTEANSLLKSAISGLESSMDGMPFHGYMPYVDQQVAANAILDQWRDFALEHGVVRYGNAHMNDLWQEKWSSNVCSRISSSPGGSGT